MRNGIVAGSYDPITFGHIYVIQQALKTVDKLFVLIADNPSKLYFFNGPKQRYEIAVDALKEALTPEEFEKIEVQLISSIKNFSVVEIAQRVGAELYFRGLRNTQDFEYEHGLQLVNLDFAPSVTTFFVMPPVELTAVSSSMVKSLVGLNGWEKIARKYVPDVVIKALKGE